MEEAQAEVRKEFYRKGYVTYAGLVYLVCQDILYMVSLVCVIFQFISLHLRIVNTNHDSVFLTLVVTLTQVVHGSNIVCVTLFSYQGKYQHILVYVVWYPSHSILSNEVVSATAP
jgi:hypothetical protein